MDAKADEVVLALTTAPDEATAARIADALVTSRLAACVNVVPGVRSTYRWKGEVERSDEVLLIVKTTRAGVVAVKGALPGIHPYELPELLVIGVDDGNEAYRRWVAENVSP